MIADPCSACSGQGRVTKERTLSVNIPAGVEDGTRIRLASEGEAGMRGGPSGDLYIFLSVKPHPFFQRDGNDLYCEIPVNFPTLALGGTITLDQPHPQAIKASKARAMGSKAQSQRLPACTTWIPCQPPSPSGIVTGVASVPLAEAVA